MKARLGLPPAAVALGLAAALAATAPAEAGIGLGPDLERCVKPVDPSAAVEWTATRRTLAELVAGGRIAIRSSYRFKACEHEFTVYVLQHADDLTQVYECPVDDTYRPVLPCFQLGRPAR